jgi:DtxR family transcriptional regulator, Mn-dependent transcriptional regulator
VRHDNDLADQDVEELAEVLWTLGEQGEDRVDVDKVRAASRVGEAFDAGVDALVARGLASLEAGRLSLSPAGQRLAQRQVRRHRLAETLFTSVLEIDDAAAVDRTACVLEHVLDAAITDSICAFLGHPAVCPHGKPIPPGTCCHTLQALEPLVQPLDRLPVGRDARIVYIAPREPARLARLGSLGIAPGVVVHLQQKSPAAVIRVGETTLALDPAIAGEIYVKRVG